MIRGNNIKWQTLKADIGGRWFLDRKSAAALIPFLIITSLLSSSNLAANPEFWEPNLALRYFGLLAANIASIAICWGYLEISAATVFRNRSRRPINWIWVLIFGLSIGFLKGSTTGLFSYLFGSELNLEIAITSRIFQTSVLGLWTIPTVTLAAATFAKFKAERELLVNERVQQALLSQSNDSIPEHQLALRKFIEDSKAKISSFRNSEQNPDNVVMIARSLREMIENGLRPISHQIWRYENSSRTGFGIRELTRLALTKNPFPLAVIAVGFSIGLLPLNVVAFRIDEALLRTFVTVVLAMSSFAIVGLIQSKVNKLPFLFFGVGNLLAATLGTVATAQIFQDRITPETGVIGLALLFWLIQLSFLSSLVSQVLATRSEIRAKLEALTGKSGASSALDLAASKFASRELAQHVHSNVQNQLLASALKLEQTEVSGEDLAKQLEEVEQLLDSALIPNKSSDSDTLESSLNEIFSRWEGFVRIAKSIDVHPKDLNPKTLQTIVRVLSEAVSNSVRHGLAASIRIGISRPNQFEAIKIRVEDDGLGPRAGQLGLGTELFNACAPGKWSLIALEHGGSELSLELNEQAIPSD